jgi:lipopolysaccharide transport system permease protein
MSTQAIDKQLKNLYIYRDLLRMWTLREVKVRYKQSALGAAWAVLQPLSLTVIFTVVFSYFARVPTENFPYPVYAYSALLPWTLFSSAISFAVPSLVTNMTLVTKIYFPKEILPLASIGAALLDYLVAILVFIGMLAYYHLPVYSTIGWFPILLLVQILLMIGVSLIASAINVFYRDIRFVIPLALQVWMYASPVIYPTSMVPERYRWIYSLNPMAGIIDGYRNITLKGESPFNSEFLLAAAISLLLALVGYLLFKKYEPEFADII